VRACFPNEKVKLFLRPPSFGLWVGTVQRTRGVCGCGRETFASATCSLRLAKASAATLSKNKASAATLSQQEENDSADVKRDGVNISGFLGAKVS